jgi:RNA 2',3'-cyclic 3'-phosphodiesterase
MPRLFTAIEIPQDVALHLSTLRGGLPGARWIDPENYHITLRFIGDVDRHTADDIAEGLSRLETSPLRVRLVGMDAFGGNKPHSVHASVEKTQGLCDLQLSHERVARRAGLKADSRKFAPHVTIARLRAAKSSDVAVYLSLRGNFSLPPFQVNRFVLYSSRTSVGGGPYVVEESFAMHRSSDPAATGAAANILHS